jgi:uncharacterized protein YndB with AHSA1/START domain
MIMKRTPGAPRVVPIARTREYQSPHQLTEGTEPVSKRLTETFTVTVDRPAADVFAYVSDVSKHAEWSPTPYRVEEVSDPTFATGTTFASYGVSRQGPDHKNDVVVTANEPNTRFVLTSTDDGDTYVNTFTFTEQDGSTTVEKVLDMPKPGGPAGLAFPAIFKQAIAPRIQEGMDTLKAKLEA